MHNNIFSIVIEMVFFSQVQILFLGLMLKNKFCKLCFQSFEKLPAPHSSLYV